MRTTRHNEFVFCKLEDGVKTFYIENFSKNTDASPFLEAKNLSECIIHGNAAVGHVRSSIFFYVTGVGQYYDVIYFGSSPFALFLVVIFVIFH